MQMPPHSRNAARSSGACAAAVLLIEPVSTKAALETYEIDGARSAVRFEVRHLASSVSGTFMRFGGGFAYDPEKPESGSATFTIEVASLETDDARRTARLAPADFFATTNFPAMQFASTTWKTADAGSFDVTGDLTIKDVTKPVVVRVVPPTSSHEHWEATATLDRRDFGVNGGPPGLIGYAVNVRISLVAHRVDRETNAYARVVMVSPDELGERLVLRGAVYAADGTTIIPGAALHVFHTDASGVYSPAASGVGDELNPRLECRLTTDERGGFEIETILPGRYPGGKTPRHVHIVVTAPDGAEHNATFSIADDPALTADDYERHARDGTFSAIRPAERGEDGVLRCVRDIRLRPGR